jgi:hypothetical protein
MIAQQLVCIAAVCCVLCVVHCALCVVHCACACDVVLPQEIGIKKDIATTAIASAVAS